MYTDIDDMLALAMLHALEDRGELKLLAVTVCTEAASAVAYVDLVNRFYGHPVPIGLIRGGITPARFQQPPFDRIPHPWAPNGVNYTEAIAALTDEKGRPRFPHPTKPTEAITLLRRTLARQPDASVTIVMVGYATNMARLLDSKPDAASPLDGRELVRRKVRLLSTMAGNFENQDRPEFNVVLDVATAQRVFRDWPTPIVASGYEIGLGMLYRQSSAERDFAYAARHPIAETYRLVAPYYAQSSKTPDQPHDHATFDLTSVLYAARPDHGYFSLSAPGLIAIGPDGASRFTATPEGNRRYLIQSDLQRATTLEAMTMLVSQPPRTSAGQGIAGRAEIRSIGR